MKQKIIPLAFENLQRKGMNAERMLDFYNNSIFQYYSQNQEVIKDLVINSGDLSRYYRCEELNFFEKSLEWKTG